MVVLYLNTCKRAKRQVVWHMEFSRQQGKKGKGSFYIAQYPVRWTAQSALHFLPPLADLLIPTPTRLLRETF